jgi:predicted phosphodiesterase
MGEGDVLVHGHTHVAGIVRAETGHAVLNPGSASMPKENTPPSYLLFDTETGIFTLRRLADDVVWASLEL